MIDKVKNFVLKNKDKVCEFKLNCGRNQVSMFSGKIVETYKAIFLVQVLDSREVKSFSYSDVLIGNLEIMM